MEAKPKVFGHLLKEVVRAGFCAGCAACVVSCEPGVLGFEREPKILGKCTSCGLCYSVCPQTPTSKSLFEPLTGAQSDPSVGSFKEALSVRSTDEEVLKRCQDGGAVSSLLLSLLEGGHIDGALLMGVGKEPWKPEARLAKTREEILEAAGTKYTRGPLFLPLKDADGFQRLAVVGVPCQVKAVRKIQRGELPYPKLGEKIWLVIGLFCMESFDHSKLGEFLKERMGVSFEEVAKFDIKKGKFICRLKNGESREIEVKALHDCVNPSCFLCTDFTSELADLSVGAVGSPLGRSTVLVRTQRGEEALEILRRSGRAEIKPLADFKPGIEGVKKVAGVKRTSAEKEREKRKEEGKSPSP
ncbi:MAG: coenzyme F420 hydrogenase subunit beta [Hadesarchaea archaeon]|nr:MAG: coenzyme F420 hydrogenase subunit beta [Hadesarchaea archaeon]